MCAVRNRCDVRYLLTIWIPDRRSFDQLITVIIKLIKNLFSKSYFNFLLTFELITFELLIALIINQRWIPHDIVVGLVHFVFYLLHLDNTLSKFHACVNSFVNFHCANSDVWFLIYMSHENLNYLFIYNVNCLNSI